MEYSKYQLGCTWRTVTQYEEETVSTVQGLKQVPASYYYYDFHSINVDVAKALSYFYKGDNTYSDSHNRNRLKLSACIVFATAEVTVLQIDSALRTNDTRSLYPVPCL